MIALRTALVAMTAMAVSTTPGVARQSGQDSTTADSARVTLEPIRVEVTRSPTATRNVPFAVGRVTADDLRRGRATLGLDEALAEIPGVFVSNRYNLSLDQRISIRGFGARSAFGVRGVKVLLDGVPQTLPDGQGQLTNIELSTVESIEVLRGSASSMYGNASGGVIAIRSETINPVRPTVSARAQGGAYGAVKWRGAASLPLGKGALAVSLTRATADGYREHSMSDQRYFAARWRHALGTSTSLGATLHASDNPMLDNPGSLTRSQVQDDPSQANQRNVDAGAGKDVRQTQASLSLDHRLPGGTTLLLTGFGMRRVLDNPLSFAYIGLERTAFGARAEMRRAMRFGDLPSTVVVGLDWQRQRDDRVRETPDRTAITQDQLERVTELGPFAQLSVDVAGRVTMTGGVRYDRIAFSAADRLLSNGDDSGERTMSAVSGSVGAVAHIVTELQPYTNVSTSFETPTTTELANRATGPGGFNPELDPQKATTVEVGARGRYGSWFSYSVAGFHSSIRDGLIPFEVPTEPGRRFFRNAGRTRHQGFEGQAVIRPVPAVSAVGAYTYAKYRFVDFTTEDGTFDGNIIPGVPQHSWYLSLRGSASNGLWLAVDHVRMSRQWVDDANTEVARGWNTYGIRAGWEGRVGAWRVAPFGAVLNVFDEAYVGSVVVNAGFGRFFEPAPPRNAYVGLEVRPGN